MALTWNGATVTTATMEDQGSRPIDRPNFDSQSTGDFGIEYKPAEPSWQTDTIYTGVMIF
jgi:hypothetical protein